MGSVWIVYGKGMDIVSQEYESRQSGKPTTALLISPAGSGPSHLRNTPGYIWFACGSLIIFVVYRYKRYSKYSKLETSNSGGHRCFHDDKQREFLLASLLLEVAINNGGNYDSVGVPSVRLVPADLASAMT